MVAVSIILQVSSDSGTGGDGGTGLREKINKFEDGNLKKFYWNLPISP